MRNSRSVAGIPAAGDAIFLPLTHWIVNRVDICLSLCINWESGFKKYGDLFCRRRKPGGYPKSRLFWVPVCICHWLPYDLELNIIMRAGVLSSSCGLSLSLWKSSSLQSPSNHVTCTAVVAGRAEQSLELGEMFVISGQGVMRASGAGGRVSHGQGRVAVQVGPGSYRVSSATVL